MSKTFEIRTVQTVSAEEIDDIITTALEGGITYWCGGARVKVEPEEDYTYLSEVLTRGGTLELHDSEEYDPDTKKYGIWRELTLESVIKGLETTEFNFEDYDAGDADNVIQRALFGDVIYG